MIFVNFKLFKFWTMARDPTPDLETLDLFLEINEQQKIIDKEKIKKEIDLDLKKFWECFSDSLKSNIRGHDGCQRILSVIAESFKYSQLNTNLNVYIIFLILLDQF